MRWPLSLRLIGLIPGAATQAGARNGFEEPRDRAAKVAGIATPRSTETTRPSFERRKSPQIGAYSSETGNRRFVQEWVVADAVGCEPVSPCIAGRFRQNAGRYDLIAC